MLWERWIRGWRVRLREVFAGDRVDRDLDEELQHHLALDIDARRARGMPPSEARRQALASFGGLTAARERVRASRSGAALGETLRDVRYGLRLLRRSPGFAVAAVPTLTLAIGATTTIFSIVDAVLLQPPPFPDADRLVTLWQTDPDTGEPVGVAPADFVDWRDRAKVFDHLAAIDRWSFDFTGAGEPEVLYGSLVTEDFFKVLGIEAAHGRVLLPSDFGKGRRVVVLTDQFWRRRFGADRDVLGQSLVLDGEPHTVVGVLAADFELEIEHGRTGRDLFAPKAPAAWEPFERGGGWWYAVGRMRSDVTLDEVRAEMDAVARSLEVDYPQTNAGVGVVVLPLHDRQVEAVRPTLLLLLGAVVLVLLIASVNVATLSLARSARRGQEIAIRAALGGGSARLLRQLLTESAVIAVLGWLGGLVVTIGVIEWIPSLMPADVPSASRIAVNGRLLGFSVGLVLTTAMLSGLVSARRVLPQDGAQLLTSARPAAVATRRHGLHHALVTAQIGLALVLLVGAGLLVKSFTRLVNVDLGFVPQDAIALQVFLDSGTATESRVSFFRETLQQIRALPDVVAAGAVSSFPLALADFTTEAPLVVRDRPPPPDGDELSAVVSLATPGYIESMRLPLRKGRWFDELDHAAAPRVAVVNETLARRLWPETEPVARRITVQVSGRAFDAEVVGVVGAVRLGGFDSRPRPEVFVPHAQGGDGGSLYDGGMTYVVRTAGDPAASIAAIQDVVWGANPEQAFYSAATVSQLLSDTLATRRLTMTLFSLFGVTALGLAGMGVYGVIAVATAQRTREIGLRIALGARSRDVTRMVVSGAIGSASVGVAAGLFVALPAARALHSHLFDVSPTDAATLVSMSLLVLGVAAGAALSPARRACRADPVVAIRTE